MNRPYYAFTALVGLLVVAMLAVGMSSRPVRPTLRQSPSALAARTAPQGLGGAAYLLVLPDEPAAAWADYGSCCDASCAEPVSCEQPAYLAGCGLDRATGRVYPVSTALAEVKLQAAVIRPAERPAVETAGGPSDCLSHHDPLYDAAVYGTKRDRETTLSEALEAADPMLQLFNSLLESQTRAAPLAPLPAQATTTGWQYELRVMAAGLANRLWLVAERIGLADDWQWIGQFLRHRSAESRSAGTGPSWADYEDWVNSLQPHAAPWGTPAGGAADSGADSGRPLLQFAVAGLNHAAKTLASWADWLESVASDRSVPQVGVRSTQVQPR